MHQRIHFPKSDQTIEITFRRTSEGWVEKIFVLKIKTDNNFLKSVMSENEIRPSAPFIPRPGTLLPDKISNSGCNPSVSRLKTRGDV